MTNDTTPATDERITAIRRYLYDQLSEEDQPRSFNEDAEYMLGVDRGTWILRMPNSVEAELSPDEYQIVVNILTEVGVWEKIV